MMNRKTLLILILFVCSVQSEESKDRFNFEVKADYRRNNLEAPLENLNESASFKGLSGKFDPCLFYVREELQREIREREYEYQQQDTEDSIQSKRERIKRIRKLIEERRPKDGRREPGIGITLPEAFQDDKLTTNRILLMGKSGTGKTSSIEALAKEAGCSCIKVIPSGSYQSEGQEIIINALLEALKEATETGQRVFLYFDECHEFAEEKIQDSSAKTLLWQILDKYDRDPRLLFVASTHKKKKIDHAFKRRWHLIEYDIPTPEELREIIVVKAKEYGCSGLPDLLIESMVKVPNITGAHIQNLFIKIASDLQSRKLTTIDAGYILLTLKKIEEDTREVEIVEEKPPSSVGAWLWQVSIGTTIAAGGAVVGHALGGKGNGAKAGGAANPASSPSPAAQSQIPAPKLI